MKEPNRRLYAIYKRNERAEFQIFAEYFRWKAEFPLCIGSRHDRWADATAFDNLEKIKLANVGQRYLRNDTAEGDQDGLFS
jgi:hypothetical protein